MRQLARTSCTVRWRLRRRVGSAACSLPIPSVPLLAGPDPLNNLSSPILSIPALSHPRQDLLNDLFDHLSLREPEEAEAQARAILTGLGFTQAQQEGPLGQLSGAPGRAG